jgi:preprotein translocase subunit SecD
MCVLFASLLTGSISILPFQGALGARQALESPSRVRLVFEPRPADGEGVRPAILDTVVQVLERRLDDFGARDASVLDSAGRIVVRASGVSELGRLRELLTRTGSLDVRITDMRHRFRDALPVVDRELRRLGIREPTAATASTGGVSELLGTRASDTTTGPFSAVLFAGQLPGEFLVPEEQVSYAESLLALPQVVVPEGIEL